MPIGIQRLNARHSHPNPLVIFIKPIPGPTSAHAHDFLSRVAAICVPIMRTHHLSVMSLEEYEPNPEFIGRNFNAGEVIQLVLKTKSGHWMGFRSVVMVMMHELAHCVQMNHSGAFWKVRNGFAGEMKGLWERGYTGEGVWGRGKTLLSGEYENKGGLGGEEMPRSLCGGTFRSGGRRKRKRGAAKGEVKREVLTYAERQQRRIAKKFGTNGVTLGDDEATRVKLEDGKKPKGKPRVAGSVRGRELRAAAALARFGQQEEKVKEEGPDNSDSENESDYDQLDPKTEEALDLDGSKLLDSKGHSMIKVCEDEDANDVHVKEEMQELQDINDIIHAPEPSTGPKVSIKQEPISSSDNRNTKSEIAIKPKKMPETLASTSTVGTAPQEVPPQPLTCPICSLINGPSSLLCLACSHVLDIRKMPGSWKCRSTACNESLYVNAADCGLCGACGIRKPA